MTAHTQVELKIKCQDLPDLDYLSKSDPQVFLLVADPITQQFDDNRVKAYTEVIKDNLNPEFSKSFILDYIFEIPQKLRFIVVDVDKFDKNDWREQEYIGRFDCTLSQIASSQGQRLIGALHNERRHSKKGTISIFFEELEESKFNLKLIISASNIPKKKSFFGSSYPRTFVTISKSREDLNWVIVHKTEIKDKIPNPCWAPIEIPLSKLCNGDLNRELKFDLIKISSDGSQKILGTAASSVNLLRSNFEKRQDSVILNLKDVDKETPKLMIDQLHIVPGPYSFLDYIRSGVQISVTMAIDFTQSNGMPSNPNSLHYIDRSGRFNQYQIAIKSIGDIIAPYDHDQLFPVYGFGARVGGSVSHCFPLNMNYNQPEVQGVNGILEAYANAINTIELYGPTNFSPTLNEVVQKVNRSDMRSNYEILVILTDGVISDMELTVMAIVDASTLPLSIIIVGIGNADFSNMERLDGDDKRLSYFNKVASRDIVQFVPMRDFMHGATHYLLPKAVLEEVPDQLKSYMSTNCIDISLPPVYS